MGYLNSSLVLHASREQTMPQSWKDSSGETYNTYRSPHQRKEVTVSSFDVHTQTLLEVEGLAVHRELQGLRPSLSALFNELAAAQCIPTPACTGANG